MRITYFGLRSAFNSRLRVYRQHKLKKMLLNPEQFSKKPLFFYASGAQPFSPLQGRPELSVFGRRPPSENMLFQGPHRSKDLS